MKVSPWRAQWASGGMAAATSRAAVESRKNGGRLQAASVGRVAGSRQQQQQQTVDFSKTSHNVSEVFGQRKVDTHTLL